MTSANKRHNADELPQAPDASDVELVASGRSSGSAPPGEGTSLLHKARRSIKNLGPPIDHVRSFVDDFQEFIQQGNMIDLAVGLILGKSFTAILDSFVGDILAPILSLFSDKSLANYYVVAKCPPLERHCTSNTWPTWQAARAAGAVTVNYGQFTENFLNFLIYALFLYIAIKKVLEVLFQRTIVMKRQCPACKEFVRGNATVCKECGHYFMPKGANDP